MMKIIIEVLIAFFGSALLGFIVGRIMRNCGGKL